ncbi:ABC transporter ATP-binding protein [Actinotalea ferrariae]|uniref:ABC transporter ATP-binding protein n=1 Tax=Actinotalea ferrariae TaxID=1386098 RepID=UPI001C8CAF91|nr:ABC transporter ATP-binding protein [Actinotalea ferrariae]MBX9244712.1 ABC transporter ATP-binding protein [Actinotalea ferrariae]
MEPAPTPAPTPAPAPASTLPDDTVITVSHLRKAYRDKVAVADVSLTVRRGEIVGMLGRNGAGKTTTVECIAGLRTPDAGTIRVLGLDPTRDGAALRERLALQLQESELPARITVREAIGLYASFYSDPADPDELLRDLGLADKAGTQFAKLSGGQRQRLSVALALVGNPEVAILDELTTGLDPRARRDTWAVIERVRDRGVTILLVTHFMEEAERLCDRIVLIDDGRVVATGSPAELATAAAEDVVLRFRVAGEVPAGLLERAADGATVTRQPDGRFEVRGGEGAVQDVLTALSGAGLRAVELQLERGSLEDAFVSLTARPLEV